MILKIMEVVLKALPDWMPRREKRVRLRSSFGRAYASANVCVRHPILTTRMLTRRCVACARHPIRQGSIRRFWVMAAGLHTLVAEMY